MSELEKEVMNGAELMDATRTVIRTLGRDKELDVSFVGDKACTDGKSVMIPSVPADTPITKRQSLVVGGYANHETLHKLLTDFKGAGERLAELQRSGLKTTAAMANAIEDIRIENGGRVMYPGMPEAINQTSREVTRNFIDNVYKDDPDCVNDFERIGPVAVTWAGRQRLGYPDESYEEAMSLLPDDIRKRVERIADATMSLEHGVRRMGADSINRTRALAGSRSAVDLAEAVMNEYYNEKEEEQDERGEPDEPCDDGDNDEPQDTPDKRDQSDAPEGDDSDGEGGEQAKDEQGDETSGNSARDDDDAEDAEEREASSRSGHGASLNNDPIDPNLESALQSTIESIKEHRRKEDFYVFAPSFDRIGYQDFIEQGWVDSRRMAYQDTLNNLGALLGTVRRKLERVLIAQDSVGWQNGAMRGRLDVTKNAAKVVQFKSNIYRKRVFDDAVNVVLTVLVDLSGSMIGQKSRVAQATAIALAEALEPTRVRYEIIGHRTGFPNALSKLVNDWHQENRRKGGRGVTAKGIDRYEALEMPLFKGFDQTLRNARPYMASIVSQVDGANADCCAIQRCAERLMAEREDRKVLVVLSDGAPAWSLGSSELNENEWTRKRILETQDKGIEVVGIGICDDSVSELYDNYVVIKDVNDLGTGVMDQVAQILTGKSVARAS